MTFNDISRKLIDYCHLTDPLLDFVDLNRASDDNTLVENKQENYEIIFYENFNQIDKLPFVADVYLNVELNILLLIKLGIL